MLAKQNHRPLFTGGLEAARLKLWHVEALKKLRPKALFFAYDGPEDREPLFEAGKLLLSNGFNRASYNLRAYVLVGYSGDTLDAAEKRLHECIAAGFMPMAMLYRDKSGERVPEWIRFARKWCRYPITSKKYRAFDLLSTGTVEKMEVQDEKKED
ncbi:MAG: hypothetical protein LBL58_10215 [Tannerellaceae bacterium]|jgi:hypothetical protein|nr:hypothetical protein [Tannerellaceae bacterium]